MKHSFIVKDDFCEHAAAVRASALESGFGTWAPNKGAVGSSIYEGMSFWGRHDLMLRALNTAFARPIFPVDMFFRITKPDTERAYIHSDRMQGGDWTCVAYLSEHDDVSGTAFYRHKETKLTEMPTFEEMKQRGIFEMLSDHMVKGADKDWEQLDFVRGMFNRAVIFRAPLFHSRFPMHGLGDGSESTARMVWACHFNI